MFAIMFSFIGTPPVYSRTVRWIERYTEYHYGSELVDFVALAWFVILSMTIYFLGRISTKTLLMTGGASVIARFFYH